MENFYNRGLNAINSQVRMLALDDFDDDEEYPITTPRPEARIENRAIVIESLHFMRFNEELYKFKLAEGITLESLYTHYYKQCYNGRQDGKDYNRCIMNNIQNTLRIWTDNGDLDFRILFYVYCIIVRGDVKGVSNMSGEREREVNPDTISTYNWMLSLARKMPISLKEPKEMPQPPIIGEYPTEYLGCYKSSLREENYPYPVIYLCPKRIEDTADRLKIDKKVLYAKVLIHELAHAIMDPTNELEGENLKSKKDNELKTKSDADVFMEESLANMITLQYFEAAKSIIGENDFEQVKSFMEIQPEAYKFGIEQFQKLHTDWREWRNNKSSMKFWMYFYSKLPTQGKYLEKLKKDYKLI